MNKSYQIPTDKTTCCYNSKSEYLETPSSLPEDLIQWTRLTLEDYSNIVKKCNKHFSRKQKTGYILLLMLVAIAVSVVLFVKKPFSQTYAAIVLAGSLLVIIIVHFVVLVNVNKKFDKMVAKLNLKYSDKGIKVEIQGVVVGSGKNRKTITRIYISYVEDWNRQPNTPSFGTNIQKYNSSTHHHEIELSSIQPSSNIPYYSAPIPPPSVPSAPVSLEKEVNDSNNNNNNNNNNNSQPLEYNYNYNINNNNNNNIPIDDSSTLYK